ncbi:MAG: hypothetical protein MJE68_34175 [Proteobacteria bacterium]|nr:hypothetical protein [Pseudomonadota bacterium]
MLITCACAEGRYGCVHLSSSAAPSLRLKDQSLLNLAAELPVAGFLSVDGLVSEQRSG